MNPITNLFKFDSTLDGLSWLKNTVFAKLDRPLIFLLMLLAIFGCICLYSASGQNWHVLFKQCIRLALGFSIMLVVAQIPPRVLKQFSPLCYTTTIVMLVAVLIMGYIGKGAQRWFNLGLFHIQPSEFTKITLPLLLCWFLNEQQLPPNPKTLLILFGIIMLPFGLVCKQPDLGTGIMLIMVSASVVVLAGLSRKMILSAIGLAIAACPLMWHFLHQYQKDRIFTFLNPESDPLGSGYHIIQSKIAVGSGGLWGKGWLHGTQSHLNFLPEHTTDFIFAVVAEEFGLIGCSLLLLLCLLIVARVFYISYHTNSTFTRLLSGSLGFLFLLSCITNISMVVGLLPIVGVPLPLVSYGGSNLVTTMISFGIIMSINAHKRLIDS